MNKKLLTILFPVILTIACSLGVWANEQVAPQPGCSNCAKAGKMMPMEMDAKDGKAGKGCDNCAKMQGSGKALADKGCANCAKVLPAENKPCCAKAQPAEVKPCCNKEKKD